MPGFLQKVTANGAPNPPASARFSSGRPATGAGPFPRSHAGRSILTLPFSRKAAEVYFSLPTAMVSGAANVALPPSSAAGSPAATSATTTAAMEKNCFVVHSLGGSSP